MMRGAKVMVFREIWVLVMGKSVRKGNSLAFSCFFLISFSNNLSYLCTHL